jgi:hypothetical protein
MPWKNTAARSTRFLSSRDVAGPFVRHQDRQRLFGEHRRIVRRKAARQEMLDQHRNVLDPIGQRGQFDRQNVKAVEKVSPEPALRNRAFQALVGCRDHADIDADIFVAADAADLVVLQHAQQPHLHVERHLADFVEEQGAVVGGFEMADAPRDGAGEAALFMAEQLGFDQFARDRAAVDRDKGGGGARRGAVQRVGDQFLASARGAGDQDRGAGLGGKAHQAPDLADRQAVAHDQVRHCQSVQLFHVNFAPLSLDGSAYRLELTI